MKNKILKHIAVSDNNYDKLLDIKYKCRLRSMDDVIIVLLDYWGHTDYVPNDMVKRGE